MSLTARRRQVAIAAACAAFVSTLTFSATASAAPGDGTSATLRSSASAGAKDLYAYLASRPTATTSNGLIAGQHLGGINNLPPSDAVPGGDGDILVTHAVSGKFPAMIGTRYDGNNGHGDSAPYVLDPTLDSLLNQVLIDRWQSTHAIVAVTATPPNPWSRQSGRSPSGSDQALSTLLRTKDNIAHPSAAFTAFWADAATIADGLEQLKNAGVPVVLRPFAEYNTGKYYGPHGAGTTATPADFQALWADVWTYYVNERHLNNLIFCWEAWVLGRNATSSTLSPWFPDPSTVDIVSGAYYFPAPTSNYFAEGSNSALTLHDTDSSNLDLTTHNNLLAVAEANNKPFGIAQWGLDYVPGKNCSYTIKGRSADATGFYNSVLSTTTGRKRTAFIYHWQDQCAMDLQDDPANFVSPLTTPSTATADDIAQLVPGRTDVNGSPDGWVEDKAAAPGKAMAQVQTSAGPMITGVAANNLSYRSVLVFDTSGIPAGATITSVTLRLHRSGTTGANPYGASATGPASPAGSLGTLSVDIAGPQGFNKNLALEKADFPLTPANGDLGNVATLPDPATDPKGWSETALSAAAFSHVNRTGVTQLRVRFSADTNTSGADSYLSWFAGDSSSAAADKPQLIVSYK